LPPGPLPAAPVSRPSRIKKGPHGLPCTLHTGSGPARLSRRAPPLGGPRSRGLRPLGVFLSILFGVLALLSVGSRPAGATTYVVTTLFDLSGTSVTVTDGSLRAAILYADNHAGTTITFTPGLSGTILLGYNLPPLTADMTITGPGASVVAVDGRLKFQPFAIHAGVTATLSGLTIQSGGNPFGTIDGSGVFNEGNLTLIGYTLTGNTSNAFGGGIYNFGDALTLIGCTLTGNSSKGGGGGVYNYNGRLALTDCTLAGNIAESGASTTCYGGGVCNNSGTLTLTGCTLNDNTAFDGGGVYDSGTATLTGCTLTGNEALNIGGGVCNFGLTTLTGCTLTGNSSKGGGGVFNYVGTLTLTGCTLTGNTAAADGGGGVYNLGTATLTDDILYGDSASVSGAEFSGTINATYCDIAGLPATPDGTHNFGADPLLSALGSYGGPTQTCALLPSSPCLGAGSPVSGHTADQRGVPIPQGGRYDIGAFESRGFTVKATQGSGQSAPVGTAFALSLTATVTANVSPEPVAGGLLTFTGPTGGASATFSPDPALIGGGGGASVTATANGVIGAPTPSPPTPWRAAPPTA